MNIQCPNTIRKCRAIISEDEQYCQSCGFNFKSFLRKDDDVISYVISRTEELNEDEYLFYLIKAYELGNTEAMYLLGNSYFNGVNVNKNVPLAYQYYAKAADKGHIKSILIFAESYYNGHPKYFEKNIDKALQCYIRVFKLGDRTVLDKIQYIANIYERNVSESSTVELENIGNIDINESINDRVFMDQKGRLNVINMDTNIDIPPFEDPIIEEKIAFELLCYEIIKKMEQLKTTIIPSYTIDYRDEDERYQFQQDQMNNSETQSQIDQYRKQLKKPYFGHMNFSDEENDEINDMYIGKELIEVNGNIKVYSWEAPVAKHFYLPTNKFQYNTINYELNYKRSINISDGKLIKVETEYSKNSNNLEPKYDSFLKHILEQKKLQGKLTDIISTIQAKQYLIITQDHNSNIIVQGCAGSGKSMVLLHRLRYLIANYGISQDNIMILTPSKMFIQHISTVSDELKLNRIKKMTLMGYYVHKLSQIDKNWKRVYDDLRLSNSNLCYIMPDFLDDEYVNTEYVEYLYSEDFIHDIKENQKKITQDLDKMSKNFKRNIDSITNYENEITKYQKEMADYNKLKRYYNDNKAELDIEYEINRDNYVQLLEIYLSKEKQYKQQLDNYNSGKQLFKPRKPEKPTPPKPVDPILPTKPVKPSMLPIYTLPEDCKKLKRNNDNNVYKCELYALLTILCLIDKKIYSKVTFEPYFFVDEAQDLRISEYALMQSINEYKTVFNLFGDVNQIIDRNNIGNWEKIRVLGVFEYFLLNENYRNTVEVANFSNDFLDTKMDSYGIDGNKVLYEKIVDLEYSLLRYNNYTRIAIISHEKHINEIQKNLLSMNQKDNISLLTPKKSKGLEFDVVYVLLDDLSKSEKYIATTRTLDTLIIIER